MRSLALLALLGLTVGGAEGADGARQLQRGLRSQRLALNR